MKNIFNFIDAWLPRSISGIPYGMAEIDSALKLRDGLGPVQVWSRNSFKLNSFVFGISDLDLTIVGNASNSLVLLPEILSKLKHKWLFIGEINVYYQEDLKALSPFINWYEVNRDPELLDLLPSIKIEDFEIEKLVFLLRMIQSDLALEKEPHFRQRKWKQHFSSMGLENKGFVNRETLLSTIFNMLTGYEHLKEALKSWDLERQSQDFDVFQTKLHQGFKILYPHQHLWFHSSSELVFENLSNFEKKILKRQIDWEIWGIYTQRLFLEKVSIETHFIRLMKVYRNVAKIDEHKYALNILQDLGFNI